MLEVGSVQACDFEDHFNQLVKEAENEHKSKKTVMKSFEETKKAQRIRENKGDLSAPVKKGGKKGKTKNNENEENKENIPGEFEMCD